MNKHDLIKHLMLSAHPLEGGYYKRTYASGNFICRDADKRNLLSSIYYMLTDDSPIGYLHKNKSDILHYHQLGSAIQYIIVTPEGELQEKVLGSDISHGEQLQLLVYGGSWKAARLLRGDYALLSEAVTPGFDYADNTIATVGSIAAQFPDLLDKLKPYIKV